jgi:hypothetical protein
MIALPEVDYSNSQKMNEYTVDSRLLRACALEFGYARFRKFRFWFITQWKPTSALPGSISGHRAFIQIDTFR